MNVITYTTVITSSVTAIATALAVIIAIQQFRKTLVEDERTRQRERIQHLKDNASLVDVWIALKKDGGEHLVVIENNSDASIRALKIDCAWGSNDLSTIPLIKVDFLPRGIWIVSRSYKPYGWDFPEDISRDLLREQYEPRFRNDETHRILNYWFSDAHEKTWHKDCSQQRLNLADEE